MNDKVFTVIVLGIMCAVALVVGRQETPHFGEATSGLPARVASTSLETVAFGSATQIATSTGDCTARVIATGQRDIYLMFGTSTTPGPVPTGAIGFVQPASTTKEYNSGYYGCGIITATSRDAISTITVQTNN